ncbi:MAG: hypothetical protein KGJ57_14835 [Sphingomonadales bacterium]|nr:hypothetical protein [Sphingomonadales bacterium]MDE2170679.1 hypothetical protein [Sphingomonadales bacterium]
MATIAPAIPKPDIFPRDDVIKALVAELLQNAVAEAQVRGINLPADVPGRMTAAVPMDSLSVVATLVAVEAVVGFELKDSLVRTGGYASVQAAVDHVVPRIQAVWEKKKSKGKKA